MNLHLSYITTTHQSKEKQHSNLQSQAQQSGFELSGRARVDNLDFAWENHTEAGTVVT